MVKPNLCDYSDAYILMKGTITITGEGDTVGERETGERKKE